MDTAPMSPWQAVVLALHFTLLAALALYGAHRYALLVLFLKHRRRPPVPAGRFAQLPRVTVQLPVYNEATVVERLVQAVARLDYPKDRLEIQVLDDSTDETTGLVRRQVEALRAQGLDVVHLHRRDRSGYKAGALAAGMAGAKGELLAIFDADFLPGPDLLQQTVHHFTDPGVGMVQVRWGHLNRRHSLLTRLQSVFLDGHFVIEHTARNRSGRCFNFNGTAGVWRKAAIQDAGGWQHDTLTEDLDLSYRAQLQGWRFVYLLDVVAPAELPVDMNAFKSQQYRWAKGSIQTSRKLLPALWRGSLPFKAKLEATFHLTANLAYPLLLGFLLLLGPALTVRAELRGGWVAAGFDASLFVLATLSVLAFYVVAQRHQGRGLWACLRVLPGLMSLGVGLAVNNARAVWDALRGHSSAFVRTPKYRSLDDAAPVHRYRSRGHWLAWVEVALSCYLAALLVLALRQGHFLVSLFLVLFAAGFGYVGGRSLAEDRRRPGGAVPAQMP